MTRPLREPSRLTRWLLPLVLVAGCSTHEKWIAPRSSDQPLVASLFGGGNQPAPLSAATVAVARPRGLDPADSSQRERLLTLLEQEADSQLTPELEFALSELAATEAEEVLAKDPDAAIGYYAESLVHGYRALAADPRRRVPGSTPRYNRSLTALLRLLRERDQVRPGAVLPLPVARSACSVAIELHSNRWTEADFQGFETRRPTYQVLGAPQPLPHVSGVGVPLIGIRYHAGPRAPRATSYYPGKICYPLTAVARAESDPAQRREMPAGRQPFGPGAAPPDRHTRPSQLGGTTGCRSRPTSPRRWRTMLDQPDLHESGRVDARPAEAGQREAARRASTCSSPTIPNRVPGVMVHGLWSSPATWMEMFNDLRARSPASARRYQFWFYLYPTREPVLGQRWHSSARTWST